MFDILIVDDDLLSLHVLRSMIEIHFSSYAQKIETVDTLNAAQEKLRKTSYDLILLDIKFPEQSGFDLLSDYYAKKKDFEVVIVSGNQKHAVTAFRYDVLDYIVKPPKKEDLERVFQRMLIKKELKGSIDKPTGEKIGISTSEGVVLVKPEELAFIEAHNLYCHVYMKNGEIIRANKTLKFVAAALPQSKFYRIQKSYLINLELIKKVSKSEGGYVQMADYELKIPISKNIKAAFYSLVKK